MSKKMALIDEKPEAVSGAIHSGLIHESAYKQVTGQAVYVDDMSEPPGLLHIHIFQSPHAHARIVNINLSAVKNADGVIAVISANDVPGTNDFGHPGTGDDPLFANGLVEYAGQSIFAVAARTVDQAVAASKLADIEYEVLEPIVTIDQALEAESYLTAPKYAKRGNSEQALAESPWRLQGKIYSGGQDHFYLESQVSMAVPKEDGDIQLYTATQDPSAAQHLVARVLGQPDNTVTIDVRRLGGAFGGKETQATQFAAIAAVTAKKTGKPAKIRLDRDDDMRITGKRHDARLDYDIGFDDKGRILGIDLQLALRCGNSEDQSLAILDRSMLHLDNSYYLENVTIKGSPCKTNTVSNCAFRGFGTPQAFVGIERIIDEIAFTLQLDPLEVRKVNFYGVDERNVTHYQWQLKDNIIHKIVAELEESSDYQARRKAIREFNSTSRWLKKGIALTPCKYSVGFTADWLNQAGALMLVYQDGSIQLNHGGVEMGQGLFTKVAQVVAEELQVDIERIRVTATTTGKVPNTSATAASSGADLNGAAAQDAAKTIKRRLRDFAADHFSVEKTRVTFLPNRVAVGDKTISFDELVKLAYMNKIQLSAAGFYQNPKIKFDSEEMRGAPYHYSAYGAAVSEVLIDTLTGEYQMQRVDILHDVGHSLNTALDYGQLEGGFIQGAGWLTTEELCWDDQGQLKSHAPSTYKIPVCSDRPKDMRMKLVEWSKNVEHTVFRSKAIGEPPFTLAVSVFNALNDAVASVADYKINPNLDAPATPERILMAVQRIQTR